MHAAIAGRPRTTRYSAIAVDYNHLVLSNNTNRGFHAKDENCFNPRMELPEVRRKNLQAIVDANYGGNASALARIIPMAQSQLADMLQGRKSFGEKVARKIEGKLGLDPMSLDDANGEAPATVNAFGRQLSPRMISLLSDLERLDQMPQIPAQAFEIIRNTIQLAAMAQAVPVAPSAPNDDDLHGGDVDPDNSFALGNIKAELARQQEARSLPTSGKRKSQK